MGGRGMTSNQTTRKRPIGVQKSHDDALEVYSEVGNIPSLDVKRAALYLAVSYGKSKELLNAVLGYTGEGYRSINRSQRSGKPSKEAELTEKFVKLSPQWEGGATYRGFNVEDAADVKVGAVIKAARGSLSSWSSEESVARSFTKPTPGMTPVVLVAKKQKRATSIAGLSEFAEEREVLVSSATQHKITKVKKRKDGRMYVEVEAL